MPQVSFTNNLKRYLSCPTVNVTGDTVHAVLHGVFETNPKLRAYVLDDQGRLRRHVKVFINDRALAPNTPETLSACRPVLESFLASVLGHNNFSLARRTAPRSLFGVAVTTAQPFDLAAVLETLAP